MDSIPDGTDQSIMDSNSCDIIPDMETTPLETTEKDFVLIVDPDVNVREKMRVVLEEDGYTVLQCDDCHAADAIIRQRKIDLVLVNIDQACDDGIDAIEIIRKDFPKLPLVVTSHTV